MRQFLIVAGSLLIAGTLIWIFLKINESPESGVALAEEIPDQVQFKFHIRPILSDKCFKCHGPDGNHRKAGLRFDIEEVAKAELTENPGKFAIVPGNLEKSELFRRIFSDDPEVMMPPPESNLSLTAADKQILKRWIEQGAEYQPHWAFIPPVKSPLPAVKEKDWITNEIDHFILKKLKENRLDPSPIASKEQLIRRVSLDITGLPPSPEEVEEFIDDDSPSAYEKLVDRLLSTPQYGERMAQVWLDVARYADSHGYQDDSYRTMWPWRDWVIHAFNENMPYNKFLTEQIAGDLIPGATKEQFLATGFGRNHPITQEGGVIDEEYRVEYVADRTNTLGKGILGITLECARCHDHKYDPVKTKEYYSMFAFFNNVGEKGLQMDAVQAANARNYADPPNITITDDDIRSLLSFINKNEGDTVKVMVMNDSIPRQAYVLLRGNYDAHGELVTASTPAAILPFSEDIPLNRLGLARWLTSPQNPLTARVFVNRLWMMVFGQGIVKTAENFGSQGSLPTHPELLDWMAVDFMENGWDIKSMLKKIVLSSTYRQSSDIRPEHMEKDPENVFLARGPRFRMSAEMIRDYILKTSGLLNAEIGGPSVKPYQPPGLWEETNAGNGRGILTAYIQDTGDKLYRRSLYTFWKRTLPPASMSIFDAPNRDLCEVRRQVTNTPLQALAVQNDIQVLEAARVLAEDIVHKKFDEENCISEAFRRILLREPDSHEMTVLEKYYRNIFDEYNRFPDKAEMLASAGSYGRKAEDDIKTASVMMIVQVIYNLDETISKE